MDKAQKEHLSACIDYCISSRLTLAECAVYLNEQGVETATGGAFTLASLPAALEECGILAPIQKGNDDAE
jgi:hypothetical protein